MYASLSYDKCARYRVKEMGKEKKIYYKRPFRVNVSNLQRARLPFDDDDGSNMRNMSATIGRAY